MADRKSGVYETRSNSEVIQARARIDELEAKRDKKRLELMDLRVFHASAWEEYGSELCSGGMIREEREVEAELKSLQDDIDLLQAYIRGEKSTEAPVADMRLAAIADHRRTLDRQQADASTESLQAQRLKQLLNK